MGSGLFAICFWLSHFFFFQAEVGIRDLVRSRGLGDVYKRQALTSGQLGHVSSRPGQRRELVLINVVVKLHHPVAVSYTHLTLPTSDLV